MGFPRQEYWSGLPFPPPGDLPDLGIEPASLVLARGFFTTEMPGKPDVNLDAWNILSREKKKKNSSSYDPTPGMRGRVWTWTFSERSLKPLQSASLFCLFLPVWNEVPCRDLTSQGMTSPPTHTHTHTHTGYTVDSSSPISDSLRLHHDLYSLTHILLPC